MDTAAWLSTNPLVRKLQLYAALSDDDVGLIERVAVAKTRDVEAHEDIIREGDEPEHVNLVLSGWACRYKQLPNGRRQMLAYLFPGDLCDLRIFLLNDMDHSVGAVTSVRIAEISAKDVAEMTDTSPPLNRALWRAEMVTKAIEREWLVNLGQRNAFERAAHLFCEFYTRLEAVGLAEDGSCEMPLTQSELSDTLGLSTVHMNRTLQELRSQGLITLKSKTLGFPDFERLKKVSMFSPKYLHLHLEGSGEPEMARRPSFGF